MGGKFVIVIVVALFFIAFIQLMKIYQFQLVDMKLTWVQEKLMKNQLVSLLLTQWDQLQLVSLLTQLRMLQEQLRLMTHIEKLQYHLHSNRV